MTIFIIADTERSISVTLYYLQLSVTAEIRAEKPKKSVLCMFIVLSYLKKIQLMCILYAKRVYIV